MDREVAFPPRSLNLLPSHPLYSPSLVFNPMIDLQNSRRSYAFNGDPKCGPFVRCRPQKIGCPPPMSAHHRKRRWSVDGQQRKGNFWSIVNPHQSSPCVALATATHGTNWNRCIGSIAAVAGSGSKHPELTIWSANTHVKEEANGLLFKVAFSQEEEYYFTADSQHLITHSQRS